MTFTRGLGLVIGVWLVACGGGTDVNVELKNAVSSVPPGFRATTHTGVIVESFQIPIKNVLIDPSDTYDTFRDSDAAYECSGECLVELIGPELQNLLTEENTHEVEDDDYNFVVVGSCEGNETSTFMRAMVIADIEGTRYYSQSGSPYMTTDQSAYDYAEVPLSGCGAISAHATAITVEGEPVTINLYVDMRDIVSVSHGTDATGHLGTS